MLGWIKTIFADGEPGVSRTDRELGERGENVAARHLQGKKMKVLLRNFRTELGEVDIIARDGKTLVFVEVKTRETDTVSPADQVDAAKQQQVARVARQYLTRYGKPQPDYRFDVVAIVWPQGQQPRIEHIVDAFQD